MKDDLSDVLETGQDVVPFDSEMVCDVAHQVGGDDGLYDVRETMVECGGI